MTRFSLSLGVALSALSLALSAHADTAFKGIEAQDPSFVAAQAAAKAKGEVVPNTKKAKNVILFIGDGMGISTVAAARIFEGQKLGEDAPSHALVFENFPYLALSKTYSTNNIVPDSAATASAMMTGVKTYNNALGVTAAADPEACKPTLAAYVPTLAEKALAAGLSAGTAVKSSITDATPAALFAHVGARYWQSDLKMEEAWIKEGCQDIAAWLVAPKGGQRLNVALGGGLSYFTGDPMRMGNRRDGRDLTKLWTDSSKDSVFVAKASDLRKVDLKKTDHLLGLFAAGDMEYDARRDPKEDTPRLPEMALAALDVVSKNPNGYFLMIEGSNIDKASHLNNAYGTVTETVEFAEAIKAVLAKVNLDETLVIVTADHSHPLNLHAGGAHDSPVMGLAVDPKTKSPLIANDGKPYTMVAFGTGPGGNSDDTGRDNLMEKNTKDKTYVQQALVPLGSGQHSGEDVAIYAVGPQAYRFHGVMEQNTIFFIMRDALGLK